MSVVAPSVADSGPGAAGDLEGLRADFPILRTKVRGKPLVYLDNAATTQKPHSVIDIERRYYEEWNANIHRGVHWLSEKATHEYERARDTVRAFLNARSRREIIHTRGTTESINLVAQSFARPRLRPDDEVLITEMEHHSNIVPWQMVCQLTGARLRVVPITDDGELVAGEFERSLNERTRIAAIVHVSNALGTVNPVRQMVAAAHARGVPVLLDGAQAVAHMPVDVQALDCDFYAFSGHKIFGPTGTGILYGREDLLESMPPYQGGGDMIRTVSFENTTYADLPAKFEAGTPNIAGGIGLGAAIDYVQAVGLQRIGVLEHELLRYATARALEVPGLRIVGRAREKAAVLSFLLGDIHPHDVGTILDSEGIAIRTGHHCAMPVMTRYGIPATARASFAFYNTREEVDQLFVALEIARRVFTR
ncbi:MAG: cysteine desulfurase [Gammaproteobacteria bacterium]|nr:cysteine desulfurase [Gammaproteobacteria bacterium]MCG3142823.1 Cysteine desulfurase [Gammaproteobacteria bacterium]